MTTGPGQSALALDVLLTFDSGGQGIGPVVVEVEDLAIWCEVCEAKPTLCEIVCGCFWRGDEDGSI